MAIFFAFGVIVICYSSSLLKDTITNYQPQIEQGKLIMPDPYDRLAAEEWVMTAIELYNAKSVFTSGILIGGILFLIGVMCLLFGFAFRQVNKRLEAMEKKNT